MSALYVCVPNYRRTLEIGYIRIVISSPSTFDLAGRLVGPADDVDQRVPGRFVSNGFVQAK